MKRFLKPLIALVVVAAVAVSAVFCCCIEKLAQTYSLSSPATHDCCQDDRSTPQKDTKPCSCSLTKAATAEGGQVSAVAASSLSNALWLHAAVVEPEQPFQIALLRTAYGGDSPGQTHSFPLYLRYRAIRL